MSRWTEEQYRDHLNRGTGFTTPPVKPPKFRNQKTAGGDSKKERERLRDLELLQKAGQIRDLRTQVTYALVVNDQLICTYRADAVYYEGDQLVCEDTKSVVTRKLPAYRIKVKLMQACHGITIREV